MQEKRVERTTAVVLGALAVALYVYLLWHGIGEDVLAYDLSHAFLPAADAIAHGRSPYPELDGGALRMGMGFVYPPVLGVLLAPIAWAPSLAVEVAATGGLIAAVAGTLRVLGIRDPRCYAIVFLWPPVFAGVQTANVTIPLALLAALAWRWRDESPGRSGLALGSSLAVKPVLWPILLWSAVTRRLSLLGTAVASGLALVVVSWAVIGFAGLLDHPALLRRFSELESGLAYSPYAVALDVGLPEWGARLTFAVVAVALLLGVVVLGRRGNDRACFMLAVAAAVGCSPVPHMHSFALLLVPVALVAHRFGPLWTVPLAMWVGTGTGNGEPWQTAVVMLTATVTIGGCLAAQSARTTTAIASSSKTTRAPASEATDSR